MIIKYITLKNFKSFGNNKQTLKFNTTKGDLILISGKNGNGKTSLQQSMDFSIFGIVRGKNSKRVPQNILPNRINKNLETEIEFINNLSDTSFVPPYRFMGFTDLSVDNATTLSTPRSMAASITFCAP